MKNSKVSSKIAIKNRRLFATVIRSITSLKNQQVMDFSFSELNLNSVETLPGFEEAQNLAREFSASSKEENTPIGPS